MRFSPKTFNSLITSSILVLFLTNCTAQSTDSAIAAVDTVVEINSVGQIPTPDGFVRHSIDSMSIGGYLRNLSLKKDNKVYLYNGQLKYNQEAQYAVIDIDVGNRDLQQCADATMRLRAEYLFESGEYDKIQFHFTSGHLAKWSKYAEGYRAKISGSNVTWVKTAKKDTSHPNFRKYMNLVFSYCGTQSMSKEVEQVAAIDIEPGHVFHQTGYPYGHAVTVMDVAVDSLGNKRFLLSQSYMPAQSIHILNNPNDSELSPWYAIKEGESLTTPEWTFPPNSLKRWKD